VNNGRRGQAVLVKNFQVPCYAYGFIILHDETRNL